MRNDYNILKFILELCNNIMWKFISWVETQADSPQQLFFSSFRCQCSLLGFCRGWNVGWGEQEQISEDITLARQIYCSTTIIWIEICGFLLSIGDNVTDNRGKHQDQGWGENWFFPLPNSRYILTAHLWISFIWKWVERGTFPRCWNSCIIKLVKLLYKGWSVQTRAGQISPQRRASRRLARYCTKLNTALLFSQTSLPSQLSSICSAPDYWILNRV